jgi:hypothetical protein
VWGYFSCLGDLVLLEFATVNLAKHNPQVNLRTNQDMTMGKS